MDLFFQARLQLHGLVEVALGILTFALAQLDDAAISVDARVLRVQLDGVIVVSEGVLVLAKQRIGVGAIVIGLGILRF